ncbi:adenosine receptor A3 [Aplysia californica]|uniref:Adenosine receptor A3 n=1 Tax=Aplysia californica TaxID=6500 RepID=A0ABM0K4T9_APLCA|nr:adenosine receptor A3 [Aplysia californica]
METDEDLSTQKLSSVIMALDPISTSYERPEAIIRIFLCVLVFYVPVIIVTNVLVIVTVYLVRKLHTPDNYVIAGLASADCLVGIWSLPLYILSDIPQTMPLIRSKRWTCAMRYIAFTVSQDSSLSILTLMCVDRFTSINWPFWYQMHVTNKAMLVAISVIYTAHTTKALVVYGLLMRFDETIEPLHNRCTVLNNAPHFYILQFCTAELGLQLSVSFCLCAQVSLTALREVRKLKREFHVLGISGTFRSKSYRSRMTNVKITVSLMFIFIILWLPTAFGGVMSKLVSRRVANIYRISTRLPRLANSFLNAVVYAFSKDTYRKAYWYLLTTPPYRWARLEEMMRSSEAFSSNMLASKLRKTTMDLASTSQRIVVGTED